MTGADSIVSSVVTDVAGVVVAVGPRVDGFKPGDRVVAMLNAFVSTPFIHCFTVSRQQHIHTPKILSGKVGSCVF